MELNELKAVGPKTLTNLNKLNIYTINDLITYYPYKYEYLKVSDINSVNTDNEIVVNGVVESLPKVSYIKRTFNRLSFRLITNNKLINIVIFNRAFLKPNINIGKEIAIKGKYNNLKNTLLASDIYLRKLEHDEIIPKYHLTSGLKNKNIATIIDNALHTEYLIEDNVPLSITNKYSFINKKDAINNIHHPSDVNLLKQSTLRLKYEELFDFMFKINYLKYLHNNEKNYLKRIVNFNKITELINNLPFRLTPDQETAVNDILNDFKEDKQMNRLLLGDVGSGKTIVAIIAMYANYLNGYQSALLVPTEVLANQHYYNIIKLLKDYNIHIELLLGSNKKKEKAIISNNLQDGSIDIIIGTHAILNDNIIFNNLGLVITDEQHRFGVNQRKIIRNKGLKPDILYLSATPIPRTLALTIYKDMDMSIIKQKPQSRKDIITKVVKDQDLKLVLEAILNEIKQGHQIYVVAPQIESEDNDEVKSVNLLKEKFTLAYNNKVNIGVIHGKLKSNIKDAIMNDFKNNQINILISTTVIEVGIDVENATTMVIFNADRFGLATLHQLRGRVGRNNYDAYCYLISNKDEQRLKIMEASNDGFYISEKDFEMRGEGDLFGVKQHGDMTFKIANLKNDYRIMLQAKEDSLNYLESKEYQNNDYYNKLLQSIKNID